MSKLTSALKLIRPDNWVKNLLVFAALVFSKSFLNQDFVLLAVGAFFSFSFLASSVYIINDIFDREKDRKHPIKKKRPIASGKIKIPEAIVMAVTLLFGAFAISYFIDLRLFYILGAYFVLNLLYSVKLKQVVILDAFIVSFGFVLRVVMGAWAIEVPISSWILICTFLLALFLAFGKRRHEVVLAEGTGKFRKVLTDYDTVFLDQMISIASAAAVVTYSLYTIAPETVAHFGTHRLIYTSPFVLYAIYRYQYLIYKRDSGGDPTKLFLTDAGLLVAILGWVASVSLIVYLG